MDQTYQDCLRSLTQEKREVTLVSLLKSRQKRDFLLNLKKKYAGVCVFLGQQLSKETSSIKCLLDEYNGRCATSKAYYFLTMSEALSKGVIEGRLQGLGTSYSSIATGSKREIIDAYLMLTRAMEEIQMLQKEIENMLNYYSRREKCILLKLTELSDDQHRRYIRGAVGMLRNQLHVNTFYKNQADMAHRSVYHQATSVTVPPDLHISSDSSEDERDDFI